ncbi:hypothetical protein TYRP_022738 [Tyrophagus putrescentiae]|nr:hypothetical protein TYRP_022738 [Tyrophagus putrescentiae]
MPKCRQVTVTTTFMTGLSVYSITIVTLKQELNLLGGAIMVAAAVVQFAVILLALYRCSSSYQLHLKMKLSTYLSTADQQ